MWFGYISCFFYKNSFETRVQAEAFVAAAKSGNLAQVRDSISAGVSIESRDQVIKHL